MDLGWGCPHLLYIVGGTVSNSPDLVLGRSTGCVSLTTKGPGGTAHRSTVSTPVSFFTWSCTGCVSLTTKGSGGDCPHLQWEAQSVPL